MDTQTQPTQPTLRRNTRQRQLVLDAVRVRCDHPTAEDVYRDVHAIDEIVIAQRTDTADTYGSRSARITIGGDVHSGDTSLKGFHRIVFTRNQ